MRSLDRTLYCQKRTTDCAFTDKSSQIALSIAPVYTKVTKIIQMNKKNININAVNLWCLFCVSCVSQSASWLKGPWGRGGGVWRGAPPHWEVFLHFYCEKLLVARNRKRGFHRLPGGPRCKTYGGWKFSRGFNSPTSTNQLAPGASSLYISAYRACWCELLTVCIHSFIHSFIKAVNKSWQNATEHMNSTVNSQTV